MYVRLENCRATTSEQKRLTSGNKMESIRYASKQVNKPPTRTHHDSPAWNVSFHAQSCKQRGILHHVLAPFFFPSFPRSLSAVVFFFQLYRSTSYERMTKSDVASRERFVHEQRLTILSLVALLGRWGGRAWEIGWKVELYSEKWSDKMLMG